MINFFSHVTDSVRVVRDFVERMNEDNVGVYAAQSSFFLILSMFPILMLLLMIISNTSFLTLDVVRDFGNYLPSEITPLYDTIIDEMSEKTAGGAVISITAIAALWSASKGVLSIIRGLNSVYHMEEKRNYLVLRGISALYTLALIVGIIFSLLVLVFGTSITNVIRNHVPLLYDLLSVFFRSREIISFAFLLVMFLLIYRLVHMKGMGFWTFLPGSVFSALGWILFSTVFSLYINYSGSLTYMYGSLTSIIVMMLWVYFCMYILFIGAEINIYFHTSFMKLEGKPKSEKPDTEQTKNTLKNA
ncbi:MAG: YihY/virulence factor BrkB family protein [Lachnospiraceae bacterium]|nr:YihY/virulence factor BrkB family protein [Lachnospiraceae bacterium]